MKSALIQQINTYISVAFVGAFAIGASYLIIDVANHPDLTSSSALVVELGN